MSELSKAINFSNFAHPLPRCVHDQALRDHGGEVLEPPCGCRAEYRIAELDYDARNKPKTDRCCVKCQRDIKPTSLARTVHLVGGGLFILHPADERVYEMVVGDKRGDDLGFWLIGTDCAKAIGTEWTSDEQVLP